MHQSSHNFASNLILEIIWLVCELCWANATWEEFRKWKSCGEVRSGHVGLKRDAGRRYWPANHDEDNTKRTHCVLVRKLKEEYPVSSRVKVGSSTEDDSALCLICRFKNFYCCSNLTWRKLKLTTPDNNISKFSRGKYLIEFRSIFTEIQISFPQSIAFMMMDYNGVRNDFRLFSSSCCRHVYCNIWWNIIQSF